MKPQTRQTLIGVGGQVIILTVALMEGFNGTMTATGVVTIALTAIPELAEHLPLWSRR